MNIGEANDVQALLSWLLDPHTGLHAEPAAREAAARLADRSHAALGAGMEYLDVLHGWLFLLLDCAGCSDCAPRQAVPR